MADDKFHGGDGSVGDQMSEMQYRSGLFADKPRHLIDAENAAEMAEDAFKSEALALYGDLYGDPEKPEVMDAARAVMAELKAERGVSELPRSRDTLHTIVMRTGNRVFHGATGGDPFPGVK